MLAIHWTPVNTTKHLLKNGISKSNNGVYCFPLTGHKILDKFWADLLSRSNSRGRKKYHGIIFRLTEQDMPAYFGHWIGATNDQKFNKPISSLKQLELQFREQLLWRIGEFIAFSKSEDNRYPCDKSEHFIDYALAALAEGSQLASLLLHEIAHRSYTFEDLQIVLSQSIAAKRIIKILPQTQDLGRNLRRQKINKDSTYLMRKEL